jgi:hypothetical protein
MVSFWLEFAMLAKGILVVIVVLVGLGGFVMIGAEDGPFADAFDGPLVLKKLFGRRSTYGYLQRGQFVLEESGLPIWTVKEDADLNNASSSIFLYAQLELYDEQPKELLRGKVQSFDDDGTPVSPGAEFTFRRIELDGNRAVYRATTPFILIDNPAFEGKRRSFAAILGGEWTTIVVLSDRERE